MIATIADVSVVVPVLSFASASAPEGGGGGGGHELLAPIAPIGVDPLTVAIGEWRDVDGCCDCCC